MKAFYNKVVWITGASSGIGEALAYELASEGARLALSARSQERLEPVRKYCISLGSEAEVFPFDLSHVEEIPKIAEQVLNYYNQLDLLINNGGISQRALVSGASLDVDRRIMEINYFGNIALTKAVLPRMLAQGYGHVAVTSSIVGKFGFPRRSAYSASKHALQGFYESLRTEMDGRNIKITMILPGRIRTNISLHALNEQGSEHGVMDQGQIQGMPADICARKVLRGIKKQKREILVGGKELLMVYIRKCFPFLFYPLARKAGER
ncbi:MAG: SDR family oxidoreductase [Bacteroidales bacterium]